MSDDHKPFKNLKKNAKTVNPGRPPEPESKPSGDADFAKAMRDVYDLDDPKGRRGRRAEKGDEPNGLHNPFAGLAAGSGDARERPGGAGKEPEPEKPEPPEPEPRAPSEPDEDELRFMRAMQGAEPLKGKGRRVAPPPPPKASQKPEKRDSDAEVMEELNRLVNGEIQFSLEFTDEYMHGRVKDLDPALFQKLKNGRFSFEAHVDLHGLNVEQAGLALIDFIREQYMKGARCVLVVHGRGMNSPQGRGVLKHEVQRWLTRDPLRRVVLAFVTALPRHGGAGAAYVLLRKYKKTRGKVRWDRLPPDLAWPE
jgi:DNA-nicking Smr family endonuclease